MNLDAPAARGGDRPHRLRREGAETDALPGRRPLRGRPHLPRDARPRHRPLRRAPASSPPWPATASSTTRATRSAASSCSRSSAPPISSGPTRANHAGDAHDRGFLPLRRGPLELRRGAGRRHRLQLHRLTGATARSGPTTTRARAFGCPARRAPTPAAATLEFHFCPDCGCIAFWRGKGLDAQGRRRIAVNLRLAEPEAVAAIPIDHFDGLASFEDLPRDGRCVADMWSLAEPPRGYRLGDASRQRWPPIGPHDANYPPRTIMRRV